MSGKPAIFLDRDGTIIEDTHYPRDPQNVRLIPLAVEGLRMMREKGYLLFIVSNQSGVARGIIHDDEFYSVHQKFCEVLQANQVDIAEFNYCLHHPDDKCSCRKPQPGLVPKKFGDIVLAWKQSFVVGDKDCDLQLADAIGAKAFLVTTGQGMETLRVLQENDEPDRYPVCANLLEVAKALPSLAQSA